MRLLNIGINVWSSGPEDKDVVGCGVPGVVNADEEQQQRSRRDTKHCSSWMGASHASRCRERRIRSEWQQNVTHPILEHGLVDGLCAQTSSDDQSIRNSTETQQSPTHGCRANSVPWSAQGCRKKEYGSEMNNVGSRECIAGLRLAWRAGQISDEGHDDELQSDQRTGRRSHDDIKVLPTAEWCHACHTELGHAHSRVS
jgi:hypothetical protein